PRLAGQLHRIALDALRVLARAGVLRLEGARECTDRLLVGALEKDALPALDLEQPAEILGVQRQLLVGLARTRDLQRPVGAAARETLDHAEQLERAEGLAQKGVRAGGVRLGTAALVGAGQ